MHRCFVVILDPDRFVPYGPEYDEILYFFNRDDGYSRAMFFSQSFLFGCRYYRRFWVCYLRLCCTVECYCLLDLIQSIGYCV